MYIWKLSWMISESGVESPQMRLFTELHIAERWAAKIGLTPDNYNLDMIWVHDHD